MGSKDKQNEDLALVRDWLTKTVIGLNLCPFAKQPYLRDQVRIVAARSDDLEEIYEELTRELDFLSSQKRSCVETSLIVCPNALGDFEQYLDFLDIANATLYEKGLEGIFQLASFHPDYVFAGEDEDDQSNFTNRSPFPIFHIIREDSLTEINEKPENLEKIPERNIELLRNMSSDDLKQHFHWLFTK